MDETRLEEFKQERSAIWKLLDSEGWKWLAGWIDVQVAARVAQFATPAEGMDGLVGKEYLSGELAGANLVRHYPQLKLDELTDLIDAIEAREEDDDA